MGHGSALLAGPPHVAILCSAIDSPTECSGPPHLLGPWGSAGWRRYEWPPHDAVSDRPTFSKDRISGIVHPRIKRGAMGALYVFPGRPDYLILASRNSTCFLATGSYFFLVILSVIVREFFLVT